MRTVIAGVVIAAFLGVPGCKEKAAEDRCNPSSVVELFDSEFGQASWYGEEFRGHATASGDVFDPDKLTAAHPTRAFNSYVRVVRTDTGDGVVVRINDRGPDASTGRAIDLSEGAAECLDMVSAGVASVEIRSVQVPPDFER